MSTSHEVENESAGSIIGGLLQLFGLLLFSIIGAEIFRMLIRLVVYSCYHHTREAQRAAQRSTLVENRKS